MPLACTIRFMNTSRMRARAGSVSRTLNEGMTFAQNSVPGRIPATSSAASRLPATITRPGMGACGQGTCVVDDDVAVAAIGAATQEQDVKTAGFDLLHVGPRQAIRVAADQARPAPSAAWRAASAVSSRTRPTVTMRSPPAALDEPSRAPIARHVAEPCMQAGERMFEPDRDVGRHR